jgi:hypothetical protein
MKLHLPPLRFSLRSKLLMLNAMVVAALISLSLQAWHALQVQQRSQARQVELAEALHLSKQADILHDALRADVLSWAGCVHHPAAGARRWQLVP